MPSFLARKTFLDRLRAETPPVEEQRVERVLAVARAFLAASCLVAIYIDPTEPTRYATLAYSLLLLYVLHSLAVLLVLHLQEEFSRKFRLVVHAADVLWPTLLTLFTEGPNSPFFLFFVFVLVAAAYRWGFRETIATTALGLGLLAAEALLITYEGRLGESFVEGQFEVNRLIMRGTYLLIVGILLGYLSEEEKLSRAETAAVARLMGRLKAPGGFRETLRLVGEELLRLFEAETVLLAVQEPGEGFYLWSARLAQPSGDVVVHFAGPDPARAGAYLFPFPAHSWHAVRKRRGGGLELLALDTDGRRLRNVAAVLPDSFIAAHLFESVLAVSFDFSGEWQGRIFAFQPQAQGPRPEEARFFQLLVRQVSPAVYSAYLVRRLRARAGAMERARVARELHDGAIQALTSIEMQVDVLRREAAASLPLSAGLGRVQELLRREVLDLRELMEQLKPVELDPKQLLDFLADVVQKFQRETGIAAEFVSEVEEVALPPRVCREVVRIVQESLVNVRKHAGASHVLVRVTMRDGQWILVVDDNGRGFPFSGRFTQEELDTARKGPLVIKERVRGIGGRIAVESTPGRGARLEVSIPRRSGS